MMTLEERVAEELSFKPHTHVFVVDSDAAFAQVRNIRCEESISDNSVLFEIDYNKPNPAAAIVDEYPAIESHDEYQFFINTPKLVESLRNGERLSVIFKALDDLHVQSHVFFVNPQKMSLEQCRSLTSLTVSMQNSEQINSVSLYLPGGDWWQNSEYRKEKHDGGGGLAYARVTHLSAGLDSSAFNRQIISVTNFIRDPSTMNVFGPHFSGKSWLLSAAHNYKSSTCSLSVYGNEDTALFMDRLNNADVGTRVLCIDDVHRLESRTLQRIKEQYLHIICSSLEKLPEFNSYLNTEELLKKE